MPTIELPEIRQHLDRLDRALVEIIAERQSFIPKVAEFKKENNVARYQPDRESEIFQKKRALAEELGVDPDMIEDIFKRIIENSHVTEKEIIGE